MYDIKFSKDVLSDDGHTFNCVQYALKVRRARSVDRAIQAAARRFERSRGIPSWTFGADRLELVIGRDDAVKKVSSHP